MKRVYFFAFMLLSCFFFISTPAQAAGTTIDLTSSSNYNLRFDGPAASAGVGFNKTSFGDVNNNGRNDLIIAAGNADVAGSGYGAVYIIYDTLLDSLNASGSKNFDLSSSSNYTVRIDGISSSLFGYYTKIANITGTSANELIIGSTGNDDTQSRTNNGAVYIITNAAISGYGITTGNSFAVSDTSKWHYRIDGAASSDFLSAPYVADINNDGNMDLLASSTGTSNTGSLAGSTYIILNSLISGTSTGNTLNLSTSSNYTLRIDGSGASAYRALHINEPCDYNGDGLKDLAIANQATQTDKGSVYIVANSLLNLTGTGNTLSLASSSNYNVAYKGDAGAYADSSMYQCIDADGDGKDDLLIYDYVSNSYFVKGSLINTYMSSTGQNLNISSNYTAIVSGQQIETIGEYDFTNDNTNDVFAYACCSSFGTAEYGSTWIQSKSIYSALSGTGNTLAINSASNYLARFDGGAQYTYPRAVGDINNDGMKDIVFVSDQADFNSRTDSGSVWIVFNFPHTITNTNTYPTSDSIISKGTVTTTNASTTISNVQYQVDSNNPASGWSNCTADDGSFNSTTESYSCQTGTLSSGTHTIYIRAQDTNTVYSSQTLYGINTVTIGSSSSNTSSQSSAPQIPQSSGNNASGGVITANIDSNTAEQLIKTILEPNTLTYDAFLSAQVVDPKSLTSGKAGIVRVKSGNTTLWQVGKVQQIWYKAYAPGFRVANAARIIPELQKKSSIISISYTNADLVPPGKPKGKFNTKTLKLANSIDGITWKILPTSVVDTKNHTVAALHKIGGYYMIVGR